VLKLGEITADAESLVHKYDAFLNLLSTAPYEFQRDAVRYALSFLLSDRYPDLETLARANWNASPAIQSRYQDVDAFLYRMPLRGVRSATLDLATGAGKSFVMYGIAAIMLAEGLVDRVLVLCPSLTIEEGLLSKFSALAGRADLAAVMLELGAVVSVPGVKSARVTTDPGDICIENVHAVYATAGSSIADSFTGRGDRTLVLNDEAHHIFSPSDTGLRKWLEFLLDPIFDFQHIINVSGTPYIADDYFPDVVYRYGLKRAIEEGVVKKPDYKIDETLENHDWQQTYAFHSDNQATYGTLLKPITIVVTESIASCVEVWNDLVKFLVETEHLSRPQAESKVIWVASGVPTGAERAKIDAAYGKRNDADSPEKRRVENLSELKRVDTRQSSVEWIVSVSMLTEGWDVKNVFQIVPHEARAFSSKLLIQQVLGRGLRVPEGLPEQPLVKINNHQAWSNTIAGLLTEVLEVESTLWWGYDDRRSKFAFPLHNIEYTLEHGTAERKEQKASAPTVRFLPQDRQTVEYVNMSESGRHALTIRHRDLYTIGAAARLMHAFIIEKHAELGKEWTSQELETFIQNGLSDAGQAKDFLSKQNLLLLQHAFGPLFRTVGSEHPRLRRVANGLVVVEMSALISQSFSESALKENGGLWFVEGADPGFTGTDSQLWEQYRRYLTVFTEYPEAASEAVKDVARRLHRASDAVFKSPVNLLYASFQPEVRFVTLLLENAEHFDGFVKSPDQGFYTLPYSYKPANTGKTHTLNENFNPDFFLLISGSNDILVVEIKSEGDDSNRNRAKLRDGLSHFAEVNGKLAEAKEPWRYHFFFLSPEDYTAFFGRVRDRQYAGWRSGLMQALADTDTAGSAEAG